MLNRTEAEPNQLNAGRCGSSLYERTDRAAKAGRIHEDRGKLNLFWVNTHGKRLSKSNECDLNPMRLRIGQLSHLHIIVGVARIIAPKATLFVPCSYARAHTRRTIARFGARDRVKCGGRVSVSDSGNLGTCFDPLAKGLWSSGVWACQPYVDL